MKKDLENQIGSINEDFKNIYLPLDAVQRKEIIVR